MEDFGLEWVQPEIPFAHPLSPREAVFVERSVEATAAQLGNADGDEYRRRIEPFVDGLGGDRAADPRARAPDPRHPLAMARFGWVGALPAKTLMNAFSDEPAKALFAGSAAHGFLPAEPDARPRRSGFCIRSRPTDSAGPSRPGEASRSSMPSPAICGRWVERSKPAVGSTRWLTFPRPKRPCSMSLPEVLIGIAGDVLPASYRARLGRFRRGPALSRSITHSMARSRGPTSASAWPAPSTLVLGFDRRGRRGHLERTPAGPAVHPRGAAEHVGPSRAQRQAHAVGIRPRPYGSTEDFSGAIEHEIEHLAPGFRDLVIERCIAAPDDLAAYNPNYAGGDITGGAYTVHRSCSDRSRAGAPMQPPAKGIYLCSSSTPPGAGVHGMCGYWAAQAALKRDLA